MTTEAKYRLVGQEGDSRPEVSCYGSLERCQRELREGDMQYHRMWIEKRTDGRWLPLTAYGARLADDAARAAQGEAP